MYPALASCPAEGVSCRSLAAIRRCALRSASFIALSVVLLLTVTLPACGGAETQVCASDIDCGSSTVCDLGKCQSDANAPRADLRPERVVLTPQSDTTVVSCSFCRNQSYNTFDTLAVGSGSDGEVFRTYIKFNVDSLRGRDVVNAVLVLFSNTQWNQSAEVMEVLAYAPASAWSAQSTTWSSQPGGSGSPIASTPLRPEHNNTTIIDVTSLVSDWLQHTQPNRGIMLRSRNERGSICVVWHSSESVEPNNRPVIEVELR